MELSKSPDFKDAVFLEGTQIRRQLHKDVPSNLTPGAVKTRYIRITLDEFATYEGHSMLGLVKSGCLNLMKCGRSTAG